MHKLPVLRIYEYALIFGILLGISFVGYANSLHNDFMLDDSPIFSDIKLNNIKFLPNAFYYPSTHADKTEAFIGSASYYRPVAHIVFLVSYLCFGTHPFGYHLVNLFLFALMSFIVFVFVDIAFGDKLLAIITSVLFAVHPINVFYVNYITSTLHSIRFILMFLSVILYLKAWQGRHKYVLYALSLACFALTLLCHETSVVLPFYIIFASFSINKTNFKTAVFKSWPYGLVLFVYLLFRFLCTGLGSTLPALDINPFIYIATFSKIIYLYISKLILPQGIVFYWNSPWMKGWNAFIWISGLLLLYAGWQMLFKARRKAIDFFCMTWLCLGFIPVFLAAFPPYDQFCYGLIIEPQWMTFSSLGFFLYVSSVGLKLYTYWKKWVLLLFISLLVLLTAIVREHNKIWGDEYNYYFYWSEQINPSPALNDDYLADFYSRKKEYRQARYYFSKVLEKKPVAAVFYNLGVIDARLGLTEQAKKEFLRAVKMDPKFSAAYNNLGAIYFNQGDYQSAKEAFIQTIKLDKYSIEARSNLGLICLRQSDYKEAIRYYQENLDIVPNDEYSLKGLAQARRLIGTH